MLLQSVIVFVAIEHILFLILEMFFWTSPYARKAFRMTPEFAEASAKLAKNQGLYNGFLAAGLIWALICADPVQAQSLKVFFLGCVSVAGVYGAITANYRIFFIQAVPALIALGVALF